MRKTILIFLACFSLGIFAQDKLFTLEDVISGGENYRSFYPESIKQLQWRPASEEFSFVENAGLMLQKVGRKNAEQIVALSQINKACKSDFKSFPTYNWANNNELRFYKGDSLVWFDIKSKSLVKALELPEVINNSDFTDLYHKLAYTKDENLYVADWSTGKLNETQITSDGGSGIVIGQSVHRNEFGIRKGTFWSPKGNKLAFYRMDETMVSDYPLVDYMSRVAEHTPIKYPMAGMKSHHVQVGVWDAKTNQTIYLEVEKGEEEFYYTNIAFTPGEEYVTLALLNREQNHMRFSLYDANDGKYIKTVFEEKSETYVEPENAAIFLESDPKQFIWQSERSGHKHFYLYDMEKGFIKQLTKGEWDVKKVIGFDKSGDKLFFESSISGPLETQFCELNIASGEVKQLTSTNGTHSSKISKSGKYFIDTWSNLETPRCIDIVSVKSGKTIQTLLKAENPYKNHVLGETEIITVKAADGETDLYGRLIKPTNFDPNKKYPVIIYVYGGPHAQLVHNRWMGGARMWQHYMAQQGYVCFTLDNRGSAGRGQVFEDVIHRQLGQEEMKDQVAGVKFLQSLPFVDQERIGVHGWSYGGYMTISLMTNYPELFKVGVSGGPVIDWKYYEVMYGERYMDTPEQNPEGYENTSLLNKVADLKGKLLIIHGAQDPTVVMQHSLAFVRECVKEKARVDYFVYPRHEHNVRGTDRVHLMDKVTQYFLDYLPN